MERRPLPRFEVYIDSASEWRWHYLAGNGKIMADSGEGYSTKYNCEAAIGKFRSDVADAPIA